MNIGAMTYRVLAIASASARSSGVKSIRSSSVIPCRSKAGGLRRKRLCARRTFSGHCCRWNGAFLDRPHWFARHAIEDVRKRLLGDLNNRLDPPAIDGEVGQNRRGRIVVIEYVVMNGLEMPHALAGRDVETHHRRAEQVVAETVAAEQSLVALVVGR